MPVRPKDELPALMSSVRVWATDAVEAWENGTLVDRRYTVTEALEEAIGSARDAIDTMAAPGDVALPPDTPADRAAAETFADNWSDRFRNPPEVLARECRDPRKAGAA